MRPSVTSISALHIVEARRSRLGRLREGQESGDERPECLSGLPGTSRRSHLAARPDAGGR
jgi:hypothetical protein